MRFLVCLLLLSVPALAKVQLPSILTDHMVVQRGVAVHIWGTAADHESVSVSFRGASRSTTADDLGRWSVYLPPGEAGGPFDLEVKGENTVTLRDVLVGDIWVASGQSNMEFGLKNAVNGAAEKGAANQPKIRMLMIKRAVSTYPLTDASTDGWKRCNPDTAADLTAVGYFFARHLVEKLDVPVGIVHTNWGGTPVESWMSGRAIASDAAFMPVYQWWSDRMNTEAEFRVRQARKLKDWNAASAKAKAEGKPAPPWPWAANTEMEWQPAGLYNAMIAPLTPMPVRGAIWYQGESNASAERAPLYAAMFQAMIRDWRKAWGVGEFPFLFVQLANYKTSPNAYWPQLREAQLQTLSLANTGMAVTIDVGDPNDIHPKNKQEVGRRLALAARAVSYGEKFEYSGPIYRTLAAEGSSLRLWFDHAAGGFKSDGRLKGFELAGADGKFVPADVAIDGDSLVVSSAAIAQPKKVRYAWADNPEANLYNADGLPASPFRAGVGE